MRKFIDKLKPDTLTPDVGINGLTFDSPVVDSPNIKLPSSVPTNLNPSSAASNVLSRRSGLQDKLGGLKDKASGLGGGLDGLKDKASGLGGGLGGLQDKERGFRSE